MVDALDRDELLGCLGALHNGVVPVEHGRVELLRPADLVQRRAPHERRVEHNEVELDLVLVDFDELPCGALGEGLARSIHLDRRSAAALGLDLLDRVLVPVFLVERAGHDVGTEDGGGRGRDDDALHAVTVLQCALQNAARAGDCRADELLRVLDVEVEGRGGVLNCVDALDCLVERTLLKPESGRCGDCNGTGHTFVMSETTTNSSLSA